ncbi:MAG: succinate dehydrogenase [Methylophaga sp.]|nr:succinate dehydrogenase [Methylophaga sp.]
MLLQHRKRLMALAGLVLAGYLIVHMFSNLLYFNAERFNSFYQLYNLPFIRWPLLLLVLAALALHVWGAIAIRRHNAKVRPVAYHKRDYLQPPKALVTLSIILIGLFILLHIVQTLQFDPQDAYGETLALFASAGMLLIYLAGLLLIGMHLQHSLNNVLQTLGVTSKTCYPLLVTLIALLMLGFAAVPVAAYLGQG